MEPRVVFVSRHSDGTLRDAGVTVLFTRLKQPIMDMPTETHFVNDETRIHFFRNPDDALNFAWDALGEDLRETCPLYSHSRSHAARSSDTLLQV